jgi:hypothetical protein
VLQAGKTKQRGNSDAKAKQKALNSDVPVGLLANPAEGRRGVMLS